ncbi:MAG TPA: Asp23/Gls24 family envelope stress response protein [Clostridiales bacterium]|nr:Asp23/Gls24 family envelope stress response protein [Clostridiales bacterium]
MVNTVVNETGTVVISQTAIAQIAYKAVSECFGVIGMPAQNIAQFLRGEGANKGIEVKIKENGIHIMVQIQVLYGTKISEIAKNISDAVLYAVEYATGMRVETLEIKIAGIRVVD